MLCAKNLKVALAAILGVVSLVGAGTAHALINLNPSAASRNDHAPQYFSAERMVGAGVSSRTLMGAASDSYAVIAPAIPPGFENGVTYYLRFDLEGGARFSDTAAPDNVSVDTGGNTATTTVSSLLDSTETYVIYSWIPGARAANTAWITWLLPQDGIRTTHALAVEDRNYTLRVSIWNGRGDALRADYTGLGSQAPIWTTTATIAAAKQTLFTKVSDNRTITASVTSNFRRFLPATGAAPTGSTTATMGRLASAGLRFADMVGTQPVLNHEDGTQILLAEIFEEVQVRIRGSNGPASYNFGQFYLNSSCMGAAATVLATSTVDGVTALDAKLTTASTSVFCANVTGNVPPEEGEDAPYAQIEPVTYNMSLMTKLVDIAAPLHLPDTGNLPEVASGDGNAGTIIRDGTEVRIAYLTTATDFGRNWRGDRQEVIGSYNQRLVIVNHGSEPVRYKLDDFTTETLSDGSTVTATLTDEYAMGLDAEGYAMLGGDSTAVLQVRDLIQITNGARTSGKLTLIAPKANISVATVQVTIPEGQTDTVRYHPLNEL